jgi:hypothetical protein
MVQEWSAIKKKASVTYEKPLPLSWDLNGDGVVDAEEEVC